MFTQPCLPLSHSAQSYGPYTEVAVCSRRQKEDKMLNCLGNKSVERYIRHYADTPVCQVLKPAAKIESTESLSPSRERSEEQHATMGFQDLVSLRGPQFTKLVSIRTRGYQFRGCQYSVAKRTQYCITR